MDSLEYFGSLSGLCHLFPSVTQGDSITDAEQVLFEECFLLNFIYSVFKGKKGVATLHIVSCLFKYH